MLSRLVGMTDPVLFCQSVPFSVDLTSPRLSDRYLKDKTSFNARISNSYLETTSSVSASLYIFRVSLAVQYFTHPPAEGTLHDSSAKDIALNKHPKPATIHENTPAGPAISWQINPVMTKTPLVDKSD